MDDYREAQRQKWLARQASSSQGAEGDGAAAAASSSGGDDAAASSSSSAAAAAPAPAIASAAASSQSSSAAAASSSSAGPAGSSAAAAAAPVDEAGQFVRRLHILPVVAAPEQNGRGVLDLLAPELRQRRVSKAPIRTGQYLRTGGFEFVVVKSEPDHGILSTETDYFVDGEPVVRFEKVQFICLWDFESVDRASRDPSALFSEYISPYFKSISDSGEDVANIVAVGDTVKIFDMDFQVMAAEPSPPDIGIIDASTMVYVDWDSTPEFDKIHIVPFQDTLPNAYEFDVFNDYLKPYLSKNKHMRFQVNDQFTYQGVQFKVVCCDPPGPARIGKNSTIYCEGILHPSLRNLLPPELLEQLSHLPPGLQMLLLNTEALAGGYEERLMEVQDMLSRRRGMSDQTIGLVEQFRWGDGSSNAGAAASAQSQCMVCLAEFADEDEVRRLPCGHVFHAPCIDEWLRRCTDCPICKANVDRAIRQN